MKDLFLTEDYKSLLERGDTFSPDNVYFLVSSNKRNIQNINNSLLTKYSNTKFY